MTRKKHPRVTGIAKEPTAFAAKPAALFPILRRRRKDQPQPVAFALAKPFLIGGLRRHLARDDDGLTPEDRQLVRAAVNDDAYFEAAYQTMDAEMLAPDGRDWAAFGDFIERLITALIEAITKLAPFFGGIPLPI